jgi:acyl carrier protein
MDKILENYIRSNFKIIKSFDCDTDLFRSRIIDSIGLVELVHFLEGEFGVKIPFESISIEDLKTINSMIKFIEKKKAESNYEK